MILPDEVERLKKLALKINDEPKEERLETIEKLLLEAFVAHKRRKLKIDNYVV